MKLWLALHQHLVEYHILWQTSFQYQSIEEMNAKKDRFLNHVSSNGITLDQFVLMNENFHPFHLIGKTWFKKTVILYEHQN